MNEAEGKRARWVDNIIKSFYWKELMGEIELEIAREILTSGIGNVEKREELVATFEGYKKVMGYLDNEASKILLEKQENEDNGDTNWRGY